MKKTSAAKKGQASADEMKPEYRFDYAKAKPNRFAASMTGDAVAVILDEDVARVFKTSESVNSFLRSVIEALPYQPEES